MRRAMTAVGLVLGVTIGVVLPGQAGAGGFAFRFGSGPEAPAGPRTGDTGGRPRANSPWVNPPPEREHRPRHRPGRDWRDGRYYYGYPYLGHYGGTYYAAPLAPREPEPPPVAVAPPEPEPPAPPPDPRGPLFLSPARGSAEAAETWQVGDILPPGVPHVTLDWRGYDLPQPPAGRVYARVGRSVLLITASDRVIEDVLPPG